jgi:outer membrane protein assembly factor BamB
MNPNGTVKWTYQTDGPINNAPVVGPGGDIYVIDGEIGTGGINGLNTTRQAFRLYAITPSGSLDWSPPNNFYGPLAVGPDGTIYSSAAGLNGGSAVEALNPDGTQKWLVNYLYCAFNPVVGKDGSVTFLGFTFDLYGNLSPLTLFSFSSDGSQRFGTVVPNPPSVQYISNLQVQANGDIAYVMQEFQGPALAFDYTASGALRWNTSFSAPGKMSNLLALSNGSSFILFGGLLYDISAGGSAKLAGLLRTSQYSPNSLAQAPDGSVFAAVSGGLSEFNSSGKLEQTYSLIPSNLEPQNVSVGANSAIYFYNSSSNALTGLTESNKVLWTYATGGLYGAPSMDGAGNLYSLSTDGNLYKLSPAGQVQWKANLEQSTRGLGAFGAPASPTGGPLPSGSPAVAADGNVYLQYGTGVYSVAQSGGQINWVVNPTLGIQPWLSVVVGSNGTIYASGPNGLTAISPTGGILWRFADSNGLTCTPVIGPDGTVYTGDINGTVFALNPSNGAVRWENDFDYSLTLFISAVPNGPLLVSSGLANATLVYALDPATGNMLWTFNGNGNGVSGSAANIAVGSNGVAYTGVYNQGLYAFDANTGGLLWQSSNIGYVLGDIAIGGDGTLYVGTADRMVYALSPEDGSVIWSVAVQGPAGSPIVGSDGHIYMAGYEGNLYAIK